MYNKSPRKTPLPCLNADERVNSFDEVALGYDEAAAISEAQRCLGCKSRPCVSGCPVGINIPAFIAEIRDGAPEKAYRIISRSSVLPAVCGRVCPQESQCERLCVRAKSGEAVAIGNLERFAADYHFAHHNSPPPFPRRGEKSVAVIGSGPAGLSCAGYLADKGYGVTVFEALHTAGGVLVYGIPQFRLPKDIVRREIERLVDLGVVFKTDVVIGKSINIDELLGEFGFSAVFIGGGAGLPKFLGIAGEELNGVLSANEFLTRVNLMKAYEKDSATPIFVGKSTVVVGGGNVAMDAARCARRLGSDVKILYRRTRDELPARREEVVHAEEEGVKFEFLCEPIRIEGQNGAVRSIACRRMELGAPDSDGRRRPLPIENSEFRLEADSVIVAVGTSPNPMIKNSTPGLETEKWGGIKTKNADGETSLEGVYAGGDAVSGAATVILAMGAGRAAARAIDERLSGQNAAKSAPNR